MPVVTFLNFKVKTIFDLIANMPSGWLSGAPDVDVLPVIVSGTKVADLIGGPDVSVLPMIVPATVTASLAGAVPA